MHSSPLLFFLVLWITFVQPPYLVAQNCCDTDNDIDLCYLSAAEYCFSNEGNCFNYSIDGNFMINALTQKLESPQNFGPNGTVDCDLELKKLEDVSSTQAINDCGCDIIFIPNSFVDPTTNTINLDMTFMPPEVLETIYAWSTECESNLVILTQNEAQRWGYKVEHGNVNPNTPVAGTSLNAIFDGPFGSLPFFNQGGAYQGVFINTPATGTEVLANDANGNATIGLDLATNDIVVGDIGIFCSGGAGVVTPGSGILNNNDILVCNIFALACSIAEMGSNSKFTFEICPNESVTLPDGVVVNTPGIYMDTLQAVNGCDSIITTEIIDRVIPPINFNYTGCVDDGYNMTVNGNTYNEANPSGTELLITSGGCDSLVHIELIFNSPVSAQADISLCPGENYIMANGEIITENGNYIDTLIGSNGCDSVLFFEIINFPDNTDYFTQELCPSDSVVVNGQSYFAGSTYIDTLTNQYGCDSLLITDLILFPEPQVRIDTFSEVRQSVSSPFNNDIPSIYDINWSPSEILSCAGCPNPVVLSNNGITQLELSITDEYECLWLFPVSVEYICNAYVPNAFSPNDDGFNDVFQLYNSGCPLEGFEMHIFDRWGGNVFYSNDLNIGWDGTYDGKKAELGVYVYQIVFSAFGKKEFLEGDVVVIR